MKYRLCLAAWAAVPSLIGPCVAHGQARAPAGEQRVALVIGNSAYKEAPLRNPVNDARAIAARLRTLGFDVTLRENLKSRELGGIYREFRSKITPGAVALVFYAGHGIQVKGQNYFPAVDSDIAGEEDVPLQSLNLGTLLDTMEEAKAGVNLVFLDACRDNPFARRFRSAARGLAKVEAASGTLIHYATRPGSVAADGNGRNGTYTEELLAKIGQPGIPVEQMLKQVTNSVMAKTRGRQEPWVEGSLRGDFYFIFQGPTSVQVQPPAPDPGANDRALWETVKDSNNADEFRAYLEQFPNGLFAGVARTRLKTLAGGAPPAQVATIAPPAPPSAPSPAAALAGSLQGLAPGTVFRDCDDCPEMVVIPAGTFMMGSPESEEDSRNLERPQHQVVISRIFAVGKFEVTHEEFSRFVAETNHSTSGGCTAPGPPWGTDLSKNWRSPGFSQTIRDPVTCVNWQDAKAYTQWLSRKTGKNYRLLTEAEWEYAARAGTTTPFSTGANINPTQANYDARETFAGFFTGTGTYRRQTVPVGSYQPNAFGLYDVHGNVWEWTEDCMDTAVGYKGAPSDGSVWTSSSCKLRASRGGSWTSRLGELRSANRSGGAVLDRWNTYGFRLARTD